MNSAIILCVICFLMINIIYTSAGAKVILTTLDQMIKESEIIVVGKVNDIERTAIKHKEYGYEYKVKIGVEKILKGHHVNKQIQIFYFPNLSIEAKFIIGERSIFFIKTWKGKYRTVRGYGGKVDIKDSEATPLFIRDEDKTQKLQQFIQKIRNCVKTEGDIEDSSRNK